MTVFKPASKEELIEHYRLGWNDESTSAAKKVFENEFLQRAYTLGRIDFVMRDDARSVDYQTEEQIIKSIKTNI